MGAAGYGNDPGGGSALPVHQPSLGGIVKIIAVHQLVTGHKRLVRCARIPVIHVVIGASYLTDATRVSPVRRE